MTDRPVSLIPSGATLIRKTLLPNGELVLADPTAAAAERFGAGRGVAREIRGSYTYAPDPNLAVVPFGVPDWLGIIAPPGEDPPRHLRLSTAASMSRVVPRQYQADTVDALAAVKCGIVVAPPGAGKTIIGMLAAQALGLRPLVLVHTGDLMRQWIETAVKVLGQPLNQIGDGKHTTGSDVGTCAMVQTLATWTPEQLTELAARHGVLLIDESHHVAAETYLRLLWHLGTPRRYGLTATPKRADGLTEVIHWCCGPIVATITAADLEAENVAVRPTVHRVETAFRFALAKQIKIVPATGARWSRRIAWDGQLALVSVERLLASHCAVILTGVHEEAAATLCQAATTAGCGAEAMVDSASLAACYRALCEDEERLVLVAGRAAQRVREGRTTLVLAGRVAHCQHLSDRLVAQGVEAPVLTGQMTIRKRTAILDRMRAGDLRCAVATTLADEGLDVPLLSAIVLAFPGRSDARTIQRAGRCMRVLPGKPAPVVDDIVDAEIGLFLNQWWARRRAYRGAGFEVAR